MEDIKTLRELEAKLELQWRAFTSEKRQVEAREKREEALKTYREVKKLKSFFGIINK